MFMLSILVGSTDDVFDIALAVVAYVPLSSAYVSPLFEWGCKVDW